MTTKLSLYLSANNFAANTIDVADELELQKKAVSKFEGEKLAKEDFPYWQAQYRQERAKMQGLRSQPAPSVIAAKKAAATVPAPSPQAKK